MVLRVVIFLYVLVEYIRHWIDMIVIKNFNIDLTEHFFCLTISKEVSDLQHKLHENGLFIYICCMVSWYFRVR